MIVHVKATSLIPDGGVVVRGGVGATLVDGDGVPDSLGRVVELVPEPAPEVVPAPDEPRCPVEDVEAVAAADDVAALGLGTEVAVSYTHLDVYKRQGVHRRGDDVQLVQQHGVLVERAIIEDVHLDAAQQLSLIHI